MKTNQNYPKDNVNQLVTQLLRNYAESNRHAANADLPFFTTRLWANIRQEQQAQQFWEVGVISARKWLFGLSVVALLFFFSNLVAIGLQSGFSRYKQPQSSAQFMMEEGDYVEEAVIGAWKE